MAVNTQVYHEIQNFCNQKNITLVAVSKTKPVADIKSLYDLGQRDFGENYVQELVEKQTQLPAGIRWHFIGHLQSNKVKYIASFVHLIHGVDSFKLLKEINKQAAKNNRVINVLLQVHIAKEETKFGLDAAELAEILNHPELPTLQNVCIKGLMGMASFSDNEELVRSEFKSLKALFDKHSSQSTVNNHPDSYRESTLSMGMSGDYQIAIEEGSNMVRIGSLLFGARA
jgi:pyridoxal phosphate enzyme (YggS family)